ncbi:MAG: hypothetical protein WAL30_00250 [Candidatus Aquirickettsiella sp.]
MPQLSDLIKKRAEKKFIKKEYRSWDLSGTGTVDNSPDIIETGISAEKEALSTCLKETIAPINSGNVTDNNKDNISDNKQVTNKAIDNKTDNIQITHIKPVDNIKDNKLDNCSDNVLDNTENTVFLTDSIRKLSGIQKKIFFYVIDLCSYRGQLQSNPILTNDLAEIANCSFGSAKTSLIRLINKKLIIRKKGQASKGGHIILAITKEIQTAALHAQRFNLNKHKDLYTGNITGNIPGNVLNNVVDNKPLTSSSSNIYNINTTTLELPEDWLNINVDPLSEIKFTFLQLKQLYKLAVNTPEVVQESINHFAFGLKNNKLKDKYPDPLNVLMGVLRKGDAWIENNYESPQVIAQRQIIEQKKIELEKIKQLEEDAFKLALEVWKKSLSVEELKKITAKKVGDVTPEPVRISNYFKEYVWSDVKKDYLLG